jgi:hypothetical protein
LILLPVFILSKSKYETTIYHTAALYFLCIFAQSDSTLITYSTTHDSSQHVSIPQQIIHLRDTTVIISDTSYTVYFQTKNYATVHGLLTLILPINDTIALHDSLEEIATTHDTTSITITTHATAYGVFIVNSPQTPFASRIHQSKSINALCTYYRYNINLSDEYRVQQIKDSGQKVAVMFNYLADNTHLSAENYRILGAYYGYAMKKFLIDGVKNFIYPSACTGIANRVTVTFNVPVAPLIFDTDNIIDPGAFGFNALDATGAQIKIKSVTLSGNQVLIICARQPYKITYAINGLSKHAGPVSGPRGCLRDSQGDSVLFDNYPLHNWCPIFSINVTH